MEWCRKCYAPQTDGGSLTFDNATEMPENKFWQMIDRSLKESKDQSGQCNSLIAQLTKLTPQEILGFEMRTEQLVRQSYIGRLWCAANWMRDFCSDDGFIDFRYWLISRGKSTYYKAIKDPDSLVSQLHAGKTKHDFDFEPFGSVASDALCRLTGKETWQIPDNRPSKKLPKIDLSWTQDKGRALLLCPAIFAKVMMLKHASKREPRHRVARKKTNVPKRKKK